MSKRKIKAWAKLLIGAALMVALLIALAYGAQDLSARTSRENLSILQQSIRRAAVECYALEGWYPDNLDYLIEHYGVSVDTERYMVDYRFVASNLMPDITVLLLDE